MKNTQKCGVLQCDGNVSAAIAYQYTKRLNPSCPIDWRLHGGKQHGLQDHIEQILESNTHYDLIICPDSSTNDKEYHDALEKIGIPVLCLDHHEADIAVSDNAVIINNQTSPNYPNKDLVGAGITWQFCRYVDSLEGTNYATDYMDLAAVGQIGDMGSLLPLENRYLVKEGLSARNLKNSFLKALLEKQAYSITGKMGATWNDIVAATNATSVAFYIVPLINAMVRMGTAAEKERMFRALIEGDALVPSGKRGAKGALERVDIESVRECVNAKSRQTKVRDSAIDRIEYKIFKYDLLENKILFIELDDDDNFPPEVNGLIANYLANKYKHPTIVARLGNDGLLKGSARGVNGSELDDFKGFMNQSGFFALCQGHARACGAHLPEGNLDKFLTYANHALAAIDFNQNCFDINFARIAEDSDLEDLILDIGAHKDLWGQGVPEPVILIKNIPLTRSKISIMGTNRDTLKIEYNGISYLKFHATDLIEQLENIQELSVVGRANINEWGGQKKPQIFIDDFEKEIRI